MKNVPLLECRQVKKVYTSRGTVVYALKGVDLSLHKGEIVSLLGVNGAGKTTLSSILATVHPATSGLVTFKGVSIYDDVIAYRRALGFCPQHPNLDKDLTVAQNLWFAGRYMLMQKELIYERQEKLMKQLGLIRYRDFSVEALSGGYQQRLSIARALMHQPEIVILDEPTVGLDPDVRYQLWESIKELKALGITVILTTHYLQEAEILSDKVCVLHRGKIIMDASVDDLKSHHKKATLEEAFIEITRAAEDDACALDTTITDR